MNNVPQKAGLYWARWKDDLKYTLIANVYGTPPFLRVKAWRFLEKTTEAVNFISPEQTSDIAWGPEIIIPILEPEA